jgi:hypothetical protein
MWGGCNLQNPRVRLEKCPGGLQTPDAWLLGPGARQATPAARTSGCNHLMLGLPSLGRFSCLLVCWDAPAYIWRFGSCLSAWHTPAHMWCLGCSGRDPCPRPTWGHLTLGSCRWTQGEWVWRQDPR